MKSAASLILGALIGFSAGSVSAKGRYTRGRTLYFRKCGPCFSMGWKWSPSSLPSRLSLSTLARKWKPARVCTWMRKNKRKLKGPGCYPGRISRRQKLAVLYYIMRRVRSKGRIKKPVLKRLSSRLSKRVRFKKTAPGRRARALKRHKNLLEMRRVRRRGRRTGGYTGSLKPKTSGATTKSRTRAGKATTARTGR